MPAKTSAKSKKKAAPKARAKPKSAAPKKHKNGAAGAQSAALMADLDKLRLDAAASAEKLAQLEMQHANDGDHLRTAQARLTTQQEAEAAKLEAHNLREQLNKSRPPVLPGQLRCPRCTGTMTEFQIESVKADRCGACQGIFFKNGDVEALLKHHDEQHAKGAKSWYSGLFGRK